MVSPSLLRNNQDFFPYLSRITLGIGYWSCLWSPLLLLVQVCGQESPPILPHACLGRYVWIKSYVPLDYVGILSIKKTTRIEWLFGLIFVFVWQDQV